MGAMTTAIAPAIPLPRQREASAAIPQPPVWLAAEMPGARVTGVSKTWWDGAARGSCVTVQAAGGCYRLVPSGDRILVLPGSSRAARRALAAWRRGEATLPCLPLERDPEAVRLLG
jgi:hypothetical protein